MKNFLNSFFELKLNNTDIKSEIIAGLTTFLTMAYIIFVNPQIMEASGMDKGAIFVGTCLAAAIACFVMGIFANWPIETPIPDPMLNMPTWFDSTNFEMPSMTSSFQTKSRIGAACWIWIGPGVPN